MKAPVSHPQSVEQAAAILRAGGICAFATETVYGLGADATNAEAVLKIYEAKSRPRFNPLIAHCADVEMAKSLVRFTPLAEKLAAAFWPGPLTLVLPLKPEAGISDLVTAGLPTLAVRIPAAEQARELIREVGRPLAAPSANPSGRLSPTSAAQVRSGFADTVPLLDGGACSAGVESTIIGFDESGAPVQLRAGALPRNEIEQASGGEVKLADPHGGISAPGMMASHYAPNAAIRLNAVRPEADEVWLAFGPSEAFAGSLNLSPDGNLREAARNLFAYLHRLDNDGVQKIAVAPIPDEGLGEAINDRLHRAAAPRG